MRSVTKIGFTLFLWIQFTIGEAKAETLLIHHVRIEGTRRPVQLETRAGQALDRGRVAADVRWLWATDHFEDIRVETDRAPGGVQLTFRLTERPRQYLRHLRFHPNSERLPLRLEPGTMIDRLRAHRIASGVQRQLVEQGYRDAVVQAELVPQGFQVVDLHLKVKRGVRYNIAVVALVGNLAMDSKRVRRKLGQLVSRRILPGFPGVWSGWQWRQPFSEARVQSQVEDLRSFYLSQGFMEASVSVSKVEFAGDQAHVSIKIDAGPKFGVSRLSMSGPSMPSFTSDAFPADALCQCLLKEKREAERQGRADFAVRLGATLGEPDGPMTRARQAMLALRFEPGRAYTVGRIEFRGHHKFGDATLRRSLALAEGDLFDSSKLRESLARLNRLSFLEPLSGDDVVLSRESDAAQIDLTFSVTERKRGRWAVSGPAVPIGPLRPLQFSIESRLPSWGPSALELSTYVAGVRLFSFANPLAQALSLQPERYWQPQFSLVRPYLPGAGWRSGFSLTPQLGWRGPAIGTGLIQARRVLASHLESGSALDPGLAVPVWRSGESHVALGFLRCEPPRSRWAWATATGRTVMDWLLPIPVL